MTEYLFFLFSFSKVKVIVMIETIETPASIIPSS